VVVIRLARQGRTKYPVYRIVAADSRRPATGKFIAILGHYNPHTKELVVKHDEVKRFLGNGAQPSNTVAKLLVRDKVELPAWVKVQTKTRAPKKEVPAEEAAPEATDIEVSAAEAEADAEVTEEVVAEAPAAEEVKADEPEERVAEVATEEAAGNDANTETIDHTDTAADEEQAADQAEATEDAAAEAATEEAPAAE